MEEELPTVTASCHCAELRHVFHHGLRDIQFAVLDQSHVAAEKGPGARECVERIVGGGLFDSPCTASPNAAAAPILPLRAIASWRDGPALPLVRCARSNIASTFA
jgi:hypothetical protein